MAHDSSTTRPEVAGSRSVARLAALVAVAMGAALLVPATAPAEAAGDPEWLVAMNDARGDAGLDPVEARHDWTGPAEESSRYMVLNGYLTHDPDPGNPGYTDDAYWAANTGNLHAASWQRTPTEAIGSWLDSPGHAFWVLNPQLTEAGYGDHYEPGVSDWSFAATLPVIDGLDRSLPWPERLTYPGDDAEVDRRPGTLYVLGSDLPEGTYTATVAVDGDEVPVEAAWRRSGRQVVVEPEHRLPLDARVDVEVRRDGQPFEAFSFTTGDGVADAPPPDQDPVPDDPDEEPAPDAPPPDDPAFALPSCRTTSVATFPDVPGGTTHADAVGCAAGLGLVGGYGDGRFRPERTITRAQVASVLHRAFEASGVDLPAGPARFDDVAGTHADAIHALAHAGVIAGRDERTFAPTAELTRAQLMTLLDRAATRLGTSLPQVDRDPFRDTGPPHADAVARAHGVGIAGGFGDGSFRPGEPVRRDHAASFVTRWLDWRADTVR